MVSCSPEAMAPASEWLNGHEKIPKQILQCSTHLSASVFLGRSERGGLELAGGEHHRLKVWRHDACKMESEKESEQAGKLHLGFMRDGTGWKVLVDGRKREPNCELFDVFGSESN